MRRRRFPPRITVAGMALAAALQTMVIPMAQAQTIHTPARGSAQREALLATARAPLEAELGKPVRFLVDALNVSGDWAFLLARMRDAHDQPFDYAGTPYADAAARGGQSQVYAALLRRDGDRWLLLHHATGPTDPAWLGWTDAGAPEALFAIPGD